MDIVAKYFQDIKLRFPTIFRHKLLPAYRRNKNIKDYLVTADLKQAVQVQLIRQCQSTCDRYGTPSGTYPPRIGALTFKPYKLPQLISSNTNIEQTLTHLNKHKELVHCQYLEPSGVRLGNFTYENNQTNRPYQDEYSIRVLQKTESGKLSVDSTTKNLTVSVQNQLTSFDQAKIQKSHFTNSSL